MSTAPDEDDLLAAELAFGLLDEAEAGDARARLHRDAGFAHAYARWQGYAAGLAADLGETPPPHVWRAITRRLPANDQAPSLVTLRLWQAGALAASLVAAVLGTTVWQRANPPPARVPVGQAAPAPMVAVLSGKQGVVSVSYDPASGRLASVVSGVDAGPHAIELWVIPVDGRPRSLGVMPQGRPGWHAAPVRSAQALRAGVTLAVSLEPLGGSPTGSPTGPVILTGKLDQAS